MLDFLFKKSRKQKEEFAAEQKQFSQQQKKVAERGEQLERGALEVTAGNTRLLDLTEKNTKISGQLVGLVQRYDDKEANLSEREAQVSEREENLQRERNEFEERKIKIRQDEIEITARKAEVRVHEGKVKSRDEMLEKEREEIKRREADAKKLSDDARTAKEDVKAKKEKMQNEGEAIRQAKVDLDAREKEVTASELALKAKSEEAEKREIGIASREKSLKESQSALDEKISEYDMKVKEIEAYKSSVDGMKFDDSEEGKSAKITVQEAIRKAIAMLDSQSREFELLKEKYCEGTFKGFSIPVEQIDIKISELRAYFEQIEKHSKDYPVMEKIVGKIFSHLSDADKFRKSYDFSECYEHICYGLEASKCYELLLEILLDADATQSETPEEENSVDEDEPDLYEILGVKNDANEKDIKRAYKEASSKWHPDKHQDKSGEEKQKAEEKMQKINKAKEILLDKRKRKEYDERRRAKE